jgi:hypothetical protein
MAHLHWRHIFFHIGMVLLFEMPAPVSAAEEGAPAKQPGLTGWLRTEGTHIIDPVGGRWMGRGANLQDTRSCESCLVRPDVHEVLRRIDALTDDWHANFIRLTMENWFSSGVITDPQYLADLTTIVDHIGQKPGVYVMLAMWHDPTLSPEGWPTAAAAPIWQRLVARFGDRPYVMFGLSNEPEGNADGRQDHEAWLRFNTMVGVIRAAEAHAHVPAHIVAVQGTRSWARSLEYYEAHPIAAGHGRNVVYETHIYNPEADFDALLSRPAQVLPVVVGEFGPIADMSLADCEALVARAEHLGVPYLGWTFHSSCAPNLIQDLSEHTCSRGEPIVPTAWGSMLMHHLQAAHAPARCP